MMVKTAEEFSAEMKEISVSEFFEKNKHLLGFDNPTKALLMAVKEAVDNSLDATEEAGILPDIKVKIKQKSEELFTVTVQDNGPGILKKDIGNVFGKLLFGSKFQRLKQSRGQQGIGISSVTLYSQLTTGNPMRVWSKTHNEKKAHYYRIHLDTLKNMPEILEESEIELKDLGDSGIRVEVDILGRYRKTVEDYLKYTSVANPFAKIEFTAPDGTKTIFPRSVNELGKPPKQIKPHPYGVEFGILQRMIKAAKSQSVLSFFVNDFSSIGATTAKELCKIAKVSPSAKPSSLVRDDIERLVNAIKNVKIQRPPTDVLSPIGEGALEKSLKKEYPDAEFVAVIRRDPEVYRGFPFLVEVGIAYGGEQTDGPVELVRIANRVPLMYQSGGCALTIAAKELDWKRYGLQQSAGSLPVGPARIVVHVASVWVPFVSESKEAIANYPEIIKEAKLAMQDAGRRLSRYLSGKHRESEKQRRLKIFDMYSVEIANSLSLLTGEKEQKIQKMISDLINERVHFKLDEAEEADESQAAEAAVAGENENEGNESGQEA